MFEVLFYQALLASTYSYYTMGTAVGYYNTINQVCTVYYVPARSTWYSINNMFRFCVINKAHTAIKYSARNNHKYLGPKACTATVCNHQSKMLATISTAFVVLKIEYSMNAVIVRLTTP